MAKNDFQYGGWNSYILQCGMIMILISHRWLHPAMWYLALESWQWIHQVAIPCYVIRGSEMTCHWTHPNVRHWNFTSGFDFDHITAVDMSFCTSLRNFIQIGPPSTEKITSCRFSRWRISAILDFRDQIMGSLKSPCTTSYRSLINTIALMSGLCPSNPGRCACSV